MHVAQPHFSQDNLIVELVFRIQSSTAANTSLTQNGSDKERRSEAI